MLLKGEDNFWSDKCCFAQKRPFLGMGWEEEIMWRVKKSFAYNFSKRDLSKVPESTLMYIPHFDSMNAVIKICNTLEGSLI